MSDIAIFGFWGAAALIAYAYFGYPFVLALCAWLRPRPVRKGGGTPRLSLLVAAYDEERSIAAKLDNILGLDYPPEAVEVIVASDGSTDATEAIVSQYASRGVRLLPQSRRGKVHALDAAAAAARGDILVFSDANTLFDRNALRMLARNFADPEVGGVCGDQRHTRGGGRDSSGNGEKLYWSYDKALKVLESRCGSIVSADGAIYAIRRELYRKPESAAVTDDFAISTAVIAQGHRLVWEPEATAWESTAGDARREFDRKVRIQIRGWRGILLRRELLDPRRYGTYSLVLWSHKVLRRLAPIFALVLLVSSLFAMRRGGLVAAAAQSQLVFYALAAAGFALRRTAVGRSRVLFAPFFFVLANAAALIAFARFVSGGRIESWQPQRGSAPEGASR